MFQDVVFIHRPSENSTPEVTTVKVRPLGHAFPWSDPTQPGCGGFILLFESENKLYYVYKIIYSADPFQTFYELSSYLTLDYAIYIGIGNYYDAEKFDNIFRQLL